MTQILPADSEGVTPGSLWWSSKREIFSWADDKSHFSEIKTRGFFHFLLKGSRSLEISFSSQF